MPAKRQDPSIRFADITKIWEAALSDGGTLFDTTSDNETIAVIYRLNQYRKIIREQDPVGWTEMDRFVVRRGRFCIEIVPRYIPDFAARLRKLDGTPSTLTKVNRKSTPDEMRELAKKLVDLSDDDGPVVLDNKWEQEVAKEVAENRKRRNF